MAALITKQQALAEIFSISGAGQTPKFKMRLFRYKNNKLTPSLEKEILKDHGYEMAQEALYTKKETKSKSKK